MTKERKFTAIIHKGDDGYFVGKIAEVPGVLSQGKNVAETQANLKDALKLFLQRDDSNDS